ncbi:MAG: ATP-binding protein [Actinobacteria bacterium]|nr:ATP-binding protein [Actinomycetota bacterium]
MALTESGIGLDASYPAQAIQVPGIRRAVNGVAILCGADGDLLVRIGLAVTEAVTNVVVHAYPAPGGGGLIHVSAYPSDGLLDVWIRDDGIGMAPRSDSPGLGLGLSLMAHETHRCEIRAASDGGGTEVLLRFELGPQPESRGPCRSGGGDPAAATA